MEGRLIAIVDDEALVRWSLKEQLQSEGCRVVEAGSVAEAASLCQTNTDLVLLDYRLPDGDGLTVLRSMKRLRPDCRVIMMTAYATPELVRDATAAGAYRVIGKPFNLSEVVALVREALAV